MTKRHAIQEAMRQRLVAIATDAGFVTNAGARVFVGEAPALGEDDPPAAIVMLVGDDIPTWQNTGFLIELPFEIQAVAKADLAAPATAVEDLLGDIKKAIELGDRKLGGLLSWDLSRGPTISLKREPGSEYVGVSITYTTNYREGWGGSTWPA